MVQRRGTGHVGRYFGPVMILWFSTLSILGAIEIARRPSILTAVDPRYAVNLMWHHPWHGFVLLGSVVLAVTGAEALYADMGHFGRSPIRRAWLRFVFPALLLNYFGQGALLLAKPAAIENPFYLLAPSWALYPLVALASTATVIASQAVISGAFSITRQAVQLGYLPRMLVRHTSEQEIGQVYVPAMNLMLLVAVVATVITFRSSDRLGGAYGIAVTGTMTVTTVLAFVYFRWGAGWPLWRLIPLFGLFLFIDLSFFSANMLKIIDGGWFPLAIGLAIYVVMMTWLWGRQRLAIQRASGALPLTTLIENLKPDSPVRVPGTAVYMTARVDNVPAALLHNMKHNKILHERNVLMTVRTEDVPRLPEAERMQIDHLSQNFHTVTIHYGFLEEPDIPRALALCRVGGFRFNLMETSFFVGREKIVAKGRSGLLLPFKRLFVLLSNLALDATEFFHIPVNRIVELGGQLELSPSVDVFLFVEGLAQAGDRKAGGLGGVDDNLFAPRHQRVGRRNFLDRLVRDHDSAVAVGMDDVIGGDHHTGDADGAAKIDQMDMRVRWHDRAGEHKKAGRHHIEIADRAVGDHAGAAEPLMDMGLHLAPERAKPGIGSVDVLDHRDAWHRLGRDMLRNSRAALPLPPRGCADAVRASG